MPNFEAIGKLTHNDKLMRDAHEKRRDYAHTITDLLKPLLYAYEGKFVALDQGKLNRSVDELKKFTNEINNLESENEKLRKEL